MKQNNKILIATGIYPPDIGGPATILKALSNSLIGAGFDVKIITYSSIKNCSEENDRAIRIIKGGILTKIKYFFKMWRLSLWADVVYVTDTYSVGYFAYLLKKIINKKYIVRFAGDAAWETAVASGWTNDYIVDFQDNKYNSKIEKLKKRRTKVLTGATKVIAVSNFMSFVAQKIGVKSDNIKVIYNSIDFIKDDGVDVEIEIDVEELKKDSKIIITACRLTPWKGIDGIIKTLPRLKKQIGNVMFLILGDGPEKENLKKLAIENGVENNVKFLGRIEHNKVISYFKFSDLFVLNTNYEGLSHTILEAMRAGVPIVTTNVGGNPETIEDGKEGFLVNYNNEDELLEAMVKIINNKELAEKFSTRAEEKLKQFNWNNTISETVKLIKNI